MNKTIAIAAVILAAGVGGWFVMVGDGPADAPTATRTGAAIVDVVVPASFSDNAQIGQRAYQANCAKCHGADAAGQDGVAPPLVHKIYETGHHGDEAFQRAAALGVRAHHWPFGNMAPVEGLTRADVTMIVAYVRELQRANGIN